MKNFDLINNGKELGTSLFILIGTGYSLISLLSQFPIADITMEELIPKILCIFIISLICILSIIFLLLDLLNIMKIDTVSIVKIVLEKINSINNNNLHEKESKSNFNNLEIFSHFVEDYLQNISPKTWEKTCDCFLDTFEAFSDEINLWEERNLKFIAYLVLVTELFGFFYYFTKTAISNAITTRRISS